MSSSDDSVARTLNDVGLAAWFGGSLMGAVGVNGASAAVSDPDERAHVANAGWGRWTPVNLAAIAAHAAGALQLTRANKGRLALQTGAGAVNGTKAVLTVVALGATAYARVLGQRLVQAEARRALHPLGPDGLPVSDATTPSSETPDDAAAAQRRLAVLQWAIPALTGAMLVLNAKAGEQQRPAQVSRGVAQRLGDIARARPVAGALSAGVLALLAARRRTSDATPSAREIMTGGAECAGTAEALADAAAKMARLGVGALPICGEDDRLKGMITDRDIVVKVVAEGRDPKTVTVGELAQGKPVTIGADDPVDEALRTMALHQVRRLPVIDGHRLIGVISQADIAVRLDPEDVGRLVRRISLGD